MSGVLQELGVSIALAFAPPAHLPLCGEPFVHIGREPIQSLWPDETRAQEFGLPSASYRELNVVGEVHVTFVWTERGEIVTPTIVKSTARSNTLEIDLDGLFDEKAIEILHSLRYPSVERRCRHTHTFTWEQPDERNADA